jgi:hypothetical protein
MRQMLENTGRADRIDDYQPDPVYSYLIDAFWRVRQFCGSDDPVNPSMLSQFCKDQGVLLNRQERDIIYRMDAEFRGALAKQRRDNERQAQNK